MKILIEELHARGHSISVMRASTSWYIAEESPLYTSITMEINEGIEDFFDAYVKENMKVCHYGLCILPHVGPPFTQGLITFSPLSGAERRGFTAYFLQDHQELPLHDF